MTFWNYFYLFCFCHLLPFLTGMQYGFCSQPDEEEKCFLLLSSFRHHCAIINAIISDKEILKAYTYDKKKSPNNLLSPCLSDQNKYCNCVLSCSQRWEYSLLSCYIPKAGSHSNHDSVMGPKGIGNRNAAFFVYFFGEARTWRWIWMDDLVFLFLFFLFLISDGWDLT